MPLNRYFFYQPKTDQRADGFKKLSIINVSSKDLATKPVQQGFFENNNFCNQIFLKTTMALWPPKPKALLMATVISFLKATS